MSRASARARRHLTHRATAVPGRPFDPVDLSDLPEPVRRYLTRAIAPGTSMAAGAVLDMRGHIKVGRWLPFRAHQVLAPQFGTVWAARVALLMTGSDRYVAGVGGMDWRLLGVVPLVHAAGDDVARSAAGRAAGESIWVPTALAPGPAVRWWADDGAHLGLEIDLDGHAVRIRHEIDGGGRLVSSHFERWGDPDRLGTWGLHHFGVEVSAYDTFDGVHLPSAGRAGWHFGTDRWEQGEFFRFEITAYRLLHEAAGPAVGPVG